MKITNATPLPGFRLSLRFDDGTAGDVDLSGYRGKGVFTVWDEPGVFEQVSVTQLGAVEWPGEIDLCPDALYQRLTGMTPEEVFLSLKQSVAHA